MWKSILVVLIHPHKPYIIFFIYSLCIFQGIISMPSFLIFFFFWFSKSLMLLTHRRCSPVELAQSERLIRPSPKWRPPNLRPLLGLWVLGTPVHAALWMGRVGWNSKVHTQARKPRSFITPASRPSGETLKSTAARRVPPAQSRNLMRPLWTQMDISRLAGSPPLVPSSLLTRPLWKALPQWRGWVFAFFYCSLFRFFFFLFFFLTFWNM